MDMKMGFQHNVSDWIDFNNDEYVQCGAPGMTMDNAMMFMTKHHPYGLLMVQHIIDQVNERVYMDGNHQKPTSVTNATGPDAIRNGFI